MKKLMSSRRPALFALLVIGCLFLMTAASVSHSNNLSSAASPSKPETATDKIGSASAEKQSRKNIARTVNSTKASVVTKALAPQVPNSFDISSFVIAGGGGTSTSGSPNFRLDGTAGQPAAGTTSTGGLFSLTGGFWQAAAPFAVVNISGTVRNCSAASPPGVANVTVTLTGSSNGTTSTNAAGLYQFTNLPAGGYDWTPSKTNAAPGSAGIDGADVIGVRRHALGTVLLTGCALQAADATNDTFVDAADVIAVRRFALGFNTGIGSCGTWHFTPPNYSVLNVQSDLTNQDFAAYMTGDTNGDTITSPTLEAAAAAQRSSAPAPVAPEVVASVNLPVASVAVSLTNFTLPVTTTNVPAADNLIGFQGDFTFDPTVITFQTPAASRAGLTSNGAVWNVQANIVSPGVLRVIGDSDGSAPLSGSGTLFNLNFIRVSNTVGASSTLTWQNAPNEFRFIDGNLTRQHPGATPPGSITIGNAPSASNGVVVGRITTPDGTPVSGAVIRLTGAQNRKLITDANGNYRFENVETNGFYTVTPSRANFTFSPSMRAFSQVAETTEAAFGATFTGDAANPLDTAEYFVRQQYVDVLGREPDEAGFNYWSNQILACGNDPSCMRDRRRDVAAAFFIEAEFQRTGSFIYGLYDGGLGRKPLFAEFATDRLQLASATDLEQARQRFADAFVTRSEFVARYQRFTTGDSFVDALLANAGQTAGVNLTVERANLIRIYNGGANQDQSRSLVIRALVDIPEFHRAEYNPAFVLTEYFSYLRRDPDRAGYEFWLDVLNNRAVNSYQSMVCAFTTSREYQERFSSVVSHTNGECGP